MSLGPVMADIEGFELTAEDREVLCHPQVGGIILFRRNFDNVEQLQNLVTEIHNLRQPRLLVAVDHEGGRVQRFQQGFTGLPPLVALGDLHAQEPARATQLAEDLGWVSAAELLGVGIDLAFAPVLDLNHGVSSVIGDRALGRQPDLVAHLAQAIMRGMKAAGMAATGKHFPGHGAIAGDSHLMLPVDERDYADIADLDLRPFVTLIKAGLPSIMPAHVVYPAIDEQPAGFSHRWITDILRTELGFQGVVFSDDLSMEGAAATGGYAERAEAALAAGCDMVLVCNNRAGAVTVLESLAQYNNPTAQMRMMRLHGKAAPVLAELQQTTVWQQAVARLNALDIPTELELAID